MVTSDDRDANDDREWKKGSAELLILSLLDDRPRHGYEIAKLIETRSDGSLRFLVTSLYPLLYRLEERGLIEGRWVEKAAQRRRRYYRLTSAGRALLDQQRRSWKKFVEAVRRVTGIEYA
jgi:PadR family transcriptional regulator PadR